MVNFDHETLRALAATTTEPFSRVIVLRGLATVPEPSMP